MATIDRKADDAVTCGPLDTMRHVRGRHGLRALHYQREVVSTLSKPMTLHDTAAIERLHTTATESGRAWAQSLVASLHDAGRRAAGGWPGTLTEARFRAESMLAGATFEARTKAGEELARVLYAAARRDWLAHREAEATDFR